MSEYRTIKDLVLRTCAQEGCFPSENKLAALVHEHFPTSKWKSTHYAWYKSQIKTGKIQVPGLSTGSALDRPSNPPDSKPLVMRAITSDDLMKWHRDLLRLLDSLDGHHEQGLGPAARILRMRGANRIPRKIAALMLSVTEARNAALHEGDEPTAAEAVAVQNAWLAISDWAKKESAMRETS